MGRSTIKNIILALTVVLSGCTNIFLQPDRSLHLDPDRVGAKWTLERFKSADGTDLTGLWFPSTKSPAKGVIVHFHGNGENMTSHFLYVYWLALEGWDVFTFDYRGYGGSGGSKSIPGSVADGAAALAYARKKDPGLPIVVIGQSLGGALALASLDRDGGEGVRALVLDSTFSSYRRVARLKLKPHAVTWAFQWLPYVLVSDRYAPARLVLTRRSVPLLQVHAPGDPIVPYAEGKRLYELAPGPKEFWDIPGTGHTEAFGIQGAEFRPRLLKFLDIALSSASASAIIAK